MSKNPDPLLSSHVSRITSGGQLSKVMLILTNLFKLTSALPVLKRGHSDKVISDATNMTPSEFYFNMFMSMILVLAGGIFAGLTLGLMGQDEVYLKVISTSGERRERKYAREVLRLIGRGKHWVLVTLLLSNVITNETLPIVLDRCLGGGWPAVVASTASIVIFGEIIPQSICVRYGLQVGALFAPFVLVLMYIMYPVAYPIALLLDHILGEDHGIVYKKSGLKTLVTLHKTMGVERLNEDEVTIISAVLDLKEKSVSTIMTPMDRVYVMSADAILDEETVEEIFNAGFSRIPIHLPNEPSNFIGMLLVRVLISYDPEDALPVASFPLATLPETGVDTSCLNILNYFQEGKSHMIVVSESPGEPYGALGVLTLEDVIEELIGEEIVDESDVYVDINKNIKRTIPGPLSKRNLTSYLHTLYQVSSSNSKRNSLDHPPPISRETEEDGLSEASQSKAKANLPNTSPLLGPLERTKNWKPKNPASNPLETNKSFVTIKRPNIDSVKQSVLPGPNREPPGSSDTYGAIHTTEDGAIKEAQELHRSSLDDRRPGSHRFLLPEERETDVSDIFQKQENGRPFSNGNSHSKGNGRRYHDNFDNDIHSAHTDSEPLTEFQESRSYRTGGIIESVVNVQGVHKTIIENVTDETQEYMNSSSESLNSKRLGHSDLIISSDHINEEAQGLLSGSKISRRGSTITMNSAKSDDTRSSKNSKIWNKFIASD